MNSHVNKTRGVTGSAQSVRLRKPSMAVQSELKVNAPGDRYEKEADALADRVMRMPAPMAETKPVTGLIGRSVQRKFTNCDEETKKSGPIMRKAEPGNVSMNVSPAFTSSLNAARGGGFPLPAGTRNFLEHAFSANFSGVRVHFDSKAAEMSKSINATAFTFGSDIYFNRGAYNPQSDGGKRLLAHEISHTLQQNGASPSIQRFEARMHERDELSGLTNNTPGSLPAFSEEESFSTYFGNWMRDFNQLFVPMLNKLGVPNIVIFSVVSYLAAKKFGRVMTPEQFGYYIPSEHMDNPGGLVAQDDLLPGAPVVSAPSVAGAQQRPAAFTTTQEAVDPGSANVLGANIFSVDQTGTLAYIRRSNLHLERRLDLAVSSGRNPEGFMHLGAALHLIEDLFAHSNFIEIAIGRLLSQDPSLLPALAGTDRRVFTYSPVINVGHNSPMGPGNRPVLTTGTFIGADTLVSISSELSRFLQHPLPAPQNDAEGRAEERLIKTLLHSFDNNLKSNPGFRAGILTLLTSHGIPGPVAATILALPLEQIYTLTTLLPVIIPEELRMAIQSFIRGQLSANILQPLGRLMQAEALDATISGTSLIRSLQKSQLAQAGPPPKASDLFRMRSVEQFTGTTVEQQQKDSIAEAQRRVDALQQTPEAIVAGPSHSQISKDHANSPFFGIAFLLANVAIARIRNHIILAWNERQGAATTTFNFDWNNFPDVPATPGTQPNDATEARNLYHQSRPARATQMRESQTSGNEIIRQGGEGAPYDLAVMRLNSADQLRAVAAVFLTLANSPTQAVAASSNLNRMLGGVGIEESNRIREGLSNLSGSAQRLSHTPTADELRNIATNLNNTAGLVQNARSYASRSNVHTILINQRNEAVSLLSGSPVNYGIAIPVIAVLEDQVANTAASYLSEQSRTLEGMHQTGLANPRQLALSTVNLPDADKDFAGAPRRPEHIALIRESRLLINHPYENDWWVNAVRAYIQAHGAQIMADIEARNEGIATFRRVGERPETH